MEKHHNAHPKLYDLERIGMKHCQQLCLHCDRPGYAPENLVQFISCLDILLLRLVSGSYLVMMVNQTRHQWMKRIRMMMHLRHIKRNFPTCMNLESDWIENRRTLSDEQANKFKTIMIGFWNADKKKRKIEDLKFNIFSDDSVDSMFGHPSPTPSANIPSSGVSESYFNAQRQQLIDLILQIKELKITATRQNDKYEMRYEYDVEGLYPKTAMTKRITVKCGSRAAKLYRNPETGESWGDVYLRTDVETDLSHFHPIETKLRLQWKEQKNLKRVSKESTDTIRSMHIIYNPAPFERKVAMKFLQLKNINDVPQILFKIRGN
eukprot:896371_1